MSRLTSNAKFRAATGAADQIFSSLSNGMILYAVAVVSTAEFFGIISVQLTLLAAALGCLRGGLGTSLLLKAGEGADAIRRDGAHAVTFALLVSPFVAGAMWLFGGTETGAPTILIAVATPLVLVQDVLRYIVIAEGRPHVSALWDGVWFAGSVGLLVGCWFNRDFLSVTVLIAGWGVLAAIALLGLAVNLRLVPGRRGFVDWLRADWQHRLRYGVDSGLDQASVFVTLAAIALLVSPVATAALRGAIALLTPMSMLTSSIPLVLIPESARKGSSPKQVWRQLVGISVLASSAALLTAIVFGFLPERIGALLLGDTFPLAQDIIVIIGLQYAIGWWALAIMVWLKTFNRSTALLWLKVGWVTIMTAAPIGAAMALHTATSIAVGMAIGSTLVACVSLAWFVPWRDAQTATAAVDEPQEKDYDASAVAPSTSEIQPM